MVSQPIEAHERTLEWTPERTPAWTPAAQKAVRPWEEHLTAALAAHRPLAGYNPLKALNLD